MNKLFVTIQTKIVCGCAGSDKGPPSSYNSSSPHSLATSISAAGNNDSF